MMLASGDVTDFVHPDPKVKRSNMHSACQLCHIKFYNLTWNLFSETIAIIQLIHTTTLHKNESNV